MKCQLWLPTTGQVFEVVECVSLVPSCLPNKTNRPNCVYSQPELSFALVCGMILVMCSGYVVCVGQVLQNEPLCEIPDETRLHTASLSTLTANHVMETPGTKGSGHTQHNQRQPKANSRSTPTWSGFASSPIFGVISFTNPTGIWLPMRPPSRSPNSY